MNCDKVLYFFEKINEIPRGSGNERAVSDYLAAFGKERGLWTHRDSANNVIIKKPASKGYENSKPVVIQGHMDMVCEKNAGVLHDFEKDPIRVIYDGDFIHADGTTLGADDGIAVAMALALLDDASAVHPPLEAVFTTDEEVGMFGASSLDTTLIEGRRLINIDSEQEGVFTVGCAGGVKTRSVIPLELKAPEYTEFSAIILSGLIGGHSGIDIDKERANANKLMARLLHSLSVTDKIELSELQGGSKNNAIPVYAEAIVACRDIKRLKASVNIISEQLRAEYADTDKGIDIRVEEIEGRSTVFSDESFKRTITALMLMPDGIQSMNTVLDMPESSNNVGIVRTEGDKLSIVCAVRSALITKKTYIKAQIEELTALCGGTTEFIGDYPSWEYRHDSLLRDIFVSVYREMYGKDAVVETVHAGLECGIISEKVPDMDMISLGPDIFDIHTPRERASLSSIERVWDMLCVILKRM